VRPLSAMPPAAGAHVCMTPNTPVGVNLSPASVKHGIATKEKAPAAEAASAPENPQRPPCPVSYAAVPVRHDGVGSAAYFSSSRLSSIWA
jgi:hypothetical protein